MAQLLVYYAHPGHRFSRANRAMFEAALAIADISCVDLYAEYPRHDIDVHREQARLLEHDVIVFQFPMFWYSTPSIVKEWQDLVLEPGFAYGADGTQLAGKSMMLAITTAGPAEAYQPSGYQRFTLRTFLSPLEQTARLCKMRFAAPFVLHSSLKAPDCKRLQDHVDGYVALLQAIRDDRYDFGAAEDSDIVECDSLPLQQRST